MSLEGAAPDGRQRSPAGSGGIRVGVDARLADGRSGGVQQFVIGLASGLSGLGDGDEEYVFLARRKDGGWLEPYVHWPSRILWLDQSAEPVTSPSSGQRLRRALGERALEVRALWRDIRSRRAPHVVEIPASDGTIEEAGIDLMHFPFQAAFTTSVPSVYQPWDLQHVHLPEFFGETERFTPTSASWLNQIETWFGILSRQAIRRGAFDSVRALIAAIDTFTVNWNDGGSPFAWVKTADEILAKAVRKRPVTSERDTSWRATGEPVAAGHAERSALAGSHRSDRAHGGRPHS